jgi:DNA-binding MarR family transcriptional regulator
MRVAPLGWHTNERYRAEPCGAAIRVYTLITMSTVLDIAATRDCHCLSARRNARTITRLYEEKLRPHGLRATQFSILAALALKGVTPISELADLLGLERTTLTRSAAILVQKGWVGAAPAEDGREHPLQLRAAGRRKLESALPAWREAQEMIDRWLVQALPQERVKL